MPFRGLADGKIVTPAEVEDHQPVECPECTGILYPRDGAHRARHFVHTGTARKSCSTATGESDTHARCVALAVAALAEQYPDAGRVGAEVTIVVTGTATTPEKRRADAVVEFPEENPYFGNGLIIEVQYKHHSKDVEGTTHDYLSAGYSVAWLRPDVFGDEQLDYEVVDDAFRADDGRAYSVRRFDPGEFDPRVEANLEWQKPTAGCHFLDEYGSHNWSQISGYAHPAGYEYEFCWWCGLRRRYDQERTRFVYDHEGVLAPAIGIEALRDGVIPHPDVAADFDEWKAIDSSGCDQSFEKSLTIRTDVAPCRGPNGIHEWDRTEIIKRRSDDRVDIALWECRYCPVHLLTNHTGRAETKSAILFGKAPDLDWGLDYLNGNPRKCGHHLHHDQTDWDFCPDCQQLDP